jgi:hypothetical protein
VLGFGNCIGCGGDIFSTTIDIGVVSICVEFEIKVLRIGSSD